MRTYYTRDPGGTILNSHETSGANVRSYFSEPINGTVAALYSSASAKVGSYVYSPFGATTADAETGGMTAASNPFRYIGGYQDIEGDNNYKLGARYYDAHGHFTQPDPIVPGGGGYAYTNGDPTNSSDFSGYFSITDILDSAAKASGRFLSSTAGQLFAFAGSCLGGAKFAAPAGTYVGTVVFPVIGTADGTVLAGTAGRVGGILSYGIVGKNLRGGV